MEDADSEEDLVFVGVRENVFVPVSCSVSEGEPETDSDMVPEEEEDFVPADSVRERVDVADELTESEALIETLPVDVTVALVLKVAVPLIDPVLDDVTVIVELGVVVAVADVV